ncbi:hypothetical protein KAZ82_02585 [Candidatus Babeliales bacterium]|nr:hypothetical protein [Candidatus Babeliales bacterium]
MNKKTIVFFMVNCYHIIYPAIGYSRNQQALTYQQAKNLLAAPSSTSSTQSGSNQQCSQVCNTTATTTNPLPNFVISFYDSSSTPVHSYVFQTSTSFTYSNALLYVDIFPPSNTINSSKVTITPSDTSYAIVYTLKTPDGAMLQKSIEYMNGTTPITMVNIPTAIAIGVQTTAQGSSTPTVNTIGTNYFLPTLTSHKTTTQQRLLNNICPLSQVFWISYNESSSGSNSIQAIPIQSTLNTNMQTSTTQAAQSTTLVSPFSGLMVTPGSAINQLQITLQDSSNNSQQCTFGGNTSIFSSGDLQNGIIAHIHIFPPSYPTSVNNAYIVIVSLQTLDGLKLHKQVFTAPSFSSIPSFLQITLAGNTILSTNFTNTSNTQQTLNFMAPLRLRCIINTTSACLV